ncbi:hypothetical protein [Planktothrix agardhii]|jgi:hypothetical protein|uniref:Uncharacterized protein n=2 Tax=Planktothrix agardhii TaxID=1160 RepID=A0A073CHI8_PLAA1|nr:hypothetical protein [Planktothrix agardhii]MCF3606989.1 hypothetical protein [Planktothrix agardhii 1033]BBD52825.1 hypothetical protein NIES204_00820 [Planktothrix agardhii NIES-204]KEI67173.1 hypothetical protein A19Y_2233 [Planktothrix agardhii NIVA-CYA 126/8]MCB8751137.1 hypothetical protein [Planktothrix agardhii 1810]MCB8760001.1 hypothetical protein [Planktothrix agardhii 1813]
MKSNLTLTTFEYTASFTNPCDSSLSISDLQEIINKIETFTGDEWLSLCPDIDQGELYREWFICYDFEVTQTWEAYDYLTDDWFESQDLSQVKAIINRIENARIYIPIAA